MEILKIIADNPLLQDALKKTLVSQFETLPLEMGFSDERLGQRERARMEGKLAVDRAFVEIMNYKTRPQKEDKPMRAR